MKKYLTKPSSKFREEFDEIVRNSKSIIVTTHVGQDDDAVSCLLLIYEYITNYLKADDTKIKLIVMGVKNDRWVYFKNYDKIMFVDDLADHLKDVDTLILLDGSDWYRFSKKAEIKNFAGNTICIDHHPGPIDIHKLHLVDINYVSCAEIIYDLFYKDIEFDKHTAETIFLGIWGDTGGMRFVRPDKVTSFGVIANLVQKYQINIQTLLSKYEKIDPEVFDLVSKLMKNTEINQVGDWPSFQVSFLGIEDVKDLKESIVKYATNLYMDHYLRMIKGADWGFIITPKVKDRVCGISIRSLPGSISAKRMMSESNLGGGHNRAGGGTISKQQPKDALAEIYNWMKENKPTLD